MPNTSLRALPEEFSRIINLNFSELKEGVIATGATEVRTVALLLHNGNLMAFSPICPHAGVALCDGWMDARGQVVCPAHGYRFNPANGYNSSGEGYKLRTFQVRLKENIIFVAV